MKIAGMNVCILKPNIVSNYKLPDDLLLTPEFRASHQTWLNKFFGVQIQNVVPPKTAYIINGAFYCSLELYRALETASEITREIFVSTL